MSSAICFNLDQSKMLSSGNGLKSWFLRSTKGVFNCVQHGSKSNSTECAALFLIYRVTLLHYGSFPFTSVDESKSSPSSHDIFVT